MIMKGIRTGTLLALPFTALAGATQPLATNSTAICSSPPYDSCAFYPACLEARFHCGPAGYPLHYGLRFCTQFSAQRGQLTPAGQRWMLATMHCLQTALVPLATGDVDMTCRGLEETAFDTHAGCYIGSGLCALGVKDWEAIVEIVGVKTLVGSWDAWKETAAAAGDCAEFVAWAEGARVKRALEDL